MPRLHLLCRGLGLLQAPASVSFHLHPASPQSTADPLLPLPSSCVPPSPFGAQTPPSLGASNSFEDAVRKAERAIDRAADKAAERVRRFADKIDGKGDEAKPEDAKALSAQAPRSLALTSSDFEDVVHRAMRAVEKAAKKVRHFAHEIDGKTGSPAKEDEAVTKF